MEPSAKSHEISAFLNKAFGRTDAITTNKCVPAPIGCGQPIGPFRDAIAAKEYTISGLCQKCQDEFSG